MTRSAIVTGAASGSGEAAVAAVRPIERSRGQAVGVDLPVDGGGMAC